VKVASLSARLAGDVIMAFSPGECLGKTDIAWRATADEDGQYSFAIAL
jgi:hypothetical protein